MQARAKPGPVFFGGGKPAGRSSGFSGPEEAERAGELPRDGLHLLGGFNAQGG